MSCRWLGQGLGPNNLLPVGSSRTTLCRHDGATLTGNAPASVPRACTVQLRGVSRSGGTILV